MSKIVVGMFDQSHLAQEAEQDLRAVGFHENDITLCGLSTPENLPVHTKEVEAVPRRGSYDADQLTRELHRYGVYEFDAKCYAEQVRRGGFVVSVITHSRDADEAIKVLERDGAISLDERVAEWCREGWEECPYTYDTPRQEAPVAPAKAERADLEGEIVLPVIEESIAVGKQQVQRGGVRIYSHIEETPVQKQVTLREEHVQVERRPADRPARDSDLTHMQEQAFEWQETAEEPVVQKQERVVEEVIIRKDVSEREENVKDTVRRMEVDVQR